MSYDMYQVLLVEPFEPVTDGTGTNGFLQLTAALEGYVHEYEHGFRKFLDLPAELRDRIYLQYLISEPQPSQHKHWTWQDCSPIEHDWPQLLVITESTCKSTQVRTISSFLPTLALANHTMRAEVVRVLLRAAETIVIKDLGSLHCFTRFLESFEADWPLGTICKLKVSMYPPRPLLVEQELIPIDYDLVNSIAEFVPRCPHLHTLNLIMQYEDLCVAQVFRNYVRAKTADEVLDHYHLRKIIQCRALRRIQLDGLAADIPAWAPLPTGFDVLAGLRDLGLWLKKHFAAQEQVVEVTIVEHFWRNNSAGAEVQAYVL
jgi:hypothetical protein